MKPLLIIIKTLIIGYLWSIIFIDGIRVLLLINWKFDIFFRAHWWWLKEKWNSGEPISKEEMLFFLVLVSSIPIWFAGWIGLCIVNWKKWIKKIIFSPLYLFRKLTLKTKPAVIVKKKSVADDSKKTKTATSTTTTKKAPIKKAPLPSATLLQSGVNSAPQPIASRPTSMATQPQVNKPKEEAPINHALFDFDDDDFDFDFDLNSKETPKNEESIPSALVVEDSEKENTSKDISADNKNKKNNKNDKNAKENNKKNNNQKKQENTVNNNANNNVNNKESHTPVLDTLKQKGYDIIPAPIFKGTKIDYLAVAKDEMILCQVYKETGDWLADEEKFNDDDPLWFSESSYRVSPVYEAIKAKEILSNKLVGSGLDFKISVNVVIQAGHIINAEDMFDIWNSQNVIVSRINKGSPKEIVQFSKSIEQCEEKVSKDIFDKLKKVIYSLA